MSALDRVCYNKKIMHCSRGLEIFFVEKRFRKAVLSLQASLDFLSLVNNFATDSSKAFGLGDNESLKLALACQEVFTYLCRTEKERGFTIEAASFIYYVRISFIFDDASFDPWAFNLTAHVSPEDDASLNSLELLIASRSVDRFQIHHKPDGRLELVLIKEKSYPEAPFDGALKTAETGDFTISEGGPELLRLLSHQITSFYQPHKYPADFRSGGKMADMVGSREYSSLVAADSQGHVAGGILWSWSSEKSVKFFGPYVFNTDRQVAEALMDAMIGSLGKTEAVCVTTWYATPELPDGYCELLGSVNIRVEGKRANLDVYYRQLKEDLGCPVWTHPALTGYLRDEYNRLFFARELMPAADQGEELRPHSVFSAMFHRPQDTVTIIPVWDGMDAADNIARHVKMCGDEEMANVFFEVDLSFMWQVNLIPHLISHNFRPALLLPYTGKTDKVLFLLHRDAETAGL